MDTARRYTGVDAHRGEERWLQNEFLEEEEEEEQQEQQEEQVNAAIVEKMEELHTQHRVAGSCYLLSVFLRCRFQAEMCFSKPRRETHTCAGATKSPHRTSDGRLELASPLWAQVKQLWYSNVAVWLLAALAQTHTHT